MPSFINSFLRHLLEPLFVLKGVALGLINIVACFILLKYIKSIRTARRNARKARELGCEPLYIDKNRLPFGLCRVKEVLAAFRNQSFPILAIDLVQRTGTITFGTSVLGNQEILTVDPVNIQAFLATQFTDFDVGDYRRDALDYFLGSGIFTQDGKEWKHSRTMLRPQFARDQVSDLGIEERNVQNMFKVLPQPSPVDSWTEELDLQPFLFSLTFDSAAEFLLGERLDSQLTPKNTQSKGSTSDFAVSFDIANLGSAERMISGPFSKYVWPKGWKKAVGSCHAFIDAIVHKHLKRMRQEKHLGVGKMDANKDRYVFLEALAEETQDSLELRSQLLNILLAGRDTTAALLGWTFYELARHPEIYSKLHKTVINEFGTYSRCKPEKDISFSKLKSCSYLQYVLNESLRIYPPVPWNTRVANKDTTLPRGGGSDRQGKVFVAKGTVVNYSVHVLQRREDIWGPDASEFKPERWEGRKMGWDYIPFNGGPRICLGQQYAMTEAAYVVVRLIQRFDKLENMDPAMVPRHNNGTTNCSGNGVRVKLHAA